MTDAVSKSQFKARALQYFRQIQKSGRELIITDHGRPVIKVVPYRADGAELLRALRGSVLSYKDPTEPVATAEWESLK